MTECPSNHPPTMLPSKQRSGASSKIRPQRPDEIHPQMSQMVADERRIKPPAHLRTTQPLRLENELLRSERLLPSEKEASKEEGC
jgi:hypothetical protein